MKLPEIQDLKKLNEQELYNLRLLILKEQNQRTVFNKDKKEALFLESLNLVSFIESSLDLKLRTKSRNRDIVCLRFAIYQYLFRKDIELTKIGLIFNREHSSVIYGLQKAKEYTETEDTYFFIQNSIIQNLIKRYDTTLSN